MWRGVGAASSTFIISSLRVPSEEDGAQKPLRSLAVYKSAPPNLPQNRGSWCPGMEAVQEESLGFRARYQAGAFRRQQETFPTFSLQGCQLQFQQLEERL